MEMSTTMQEANVLPEESSEVVTRRSLVPEVLPNVFDKLDESDKPAFFRACPEWHDVRKGKRTQFLFQEVFPLLIEILPTPTLLKNREICKTWTKIGDHHVHSHPSQFQLQCEGTKVEHFPWLSNRLPTVEDVHKFMNEMETHPGNPFAGRMLFLFWRKPGWLHPRNRDEFYRLCQEYWTSLPQLLQKFGTHVHLVIFDLREVAIIGIEFDHILRNCLLLLPNLKSLEVIGQSGAPDSQLMEFYRPGQLPQLEHLENLGMIHVKDPLMQGLLISCCIPTNLKRLSLQLSFFGRQQLHLQHFINLEVLSGWLTMEELESICNLRLTTLELAIEADFVQLFNTLAAFGETLTQLVLRETPLEEPEPENRSGFRFNFPNLKKLVIAEYKGSLDLFVQLTELTELAIEEYYTKSGQGETELVQVLGFEKRMMDSNIWSLMPSLQILTLEEFGPVYERDVRDCTIIHKKLYR